MKNGCELITGFMGKPHGPHFLGLSQSEPVAYELTPVGKTRDTISGMILEVVPYQIQRGEA